MRLKLLIIMLLILPSCIFSQYLRESLWTSAMDNFASEDLNNGVQKDVVLFAGSSSLAIWTYAQYDFPDSKILNRAFGGSFMTDLIYFFSKVVAPYHPRQVVLYEGDNDLHQTTKTPEAFMEDVIAMSRLINIYYPDAKILLVSIKPSPSRLVSFSKYKIANQLMKEYADKYDYIDFADTWTPMLKSDGTPETSYFRSDMLHLNYSGYALWKSILKPYLLTKGNTSGNQNSPGDVLIDFGSDVAGFPTPGTGIIFHKNQSLPIELIDNRGVKTAFTLNITDPFSDGCNIKGPASVTGDAAVFEGTATSDSFFGNGLDNDSIVANPQAVIVLNGLNPQKYYNFSIFSSCMNETENLEVNYAFTGRDGIKSTTLDVANNFTNIAKVINVNPNDNGEITLTIEAGRNNNSITKFYNLGALLIHETDQITFVKNPDIHQNIVYEDGNLYVRNYNGKVEVLNPYGRVLSSGLMIDGKTKMNLEKGVYIVKTADEKAKIVVR